MIKGITVNGKHSYYTYGLRMLERKIGSPPKDDHTERVPYSSVTYDFDSIFGSSSYGERTLTYKFELMDLRLNFAEDRLMAVLDWLHWTDRLDLYDDMLPNYYFQVREPDVEWSESHGVYTITVKFMALPEIKPKPNKIDRTVRPEDVVLPDINGDGYVNSIDVSMILAAYSAISTGQDPGLTDAQLKACDADMDGKITSADASLVADFYAKLSTGKYTCDNEGWADFLNDKWRNKGVI